MVQASSTGTAAARVLATRPAAGSDFCLLSTDAAQTQRVTDAATATPPPRSRAAGLRAKPPASRARTTCSSASSSLPTWPSTCPPCRAPTSWPACAVFADGVCDDGKPGVGFEPARGTTGFAAGPGGQVQPAAPVSTAR